MPKKEDADISSNINSTMSITHSPSKKFTSNNTPPGDVINISALPYVSAYLAETGATVTNIIPQFSITPKFSKFIDKLDNFFGLHPKQKKISLNDLIYNLKNDATNITCVELQTTAVAYKYILPSAKQIKLRSINPDSETRPHQSYLRRIKLDKSELSDRFYGLSGVEKEYVEKDTDVFNAELTDALEQITNVISMSGLNYEERAKFHMPNFAISGDSLFSVREITYPKSKRTEQVAILKFSIESKKLENKVINEDYKIKLITNSYKD